MEYAFGGCDRGKGGGGLEAHPQRTTDFHYRASDHATRMKRARTFLLLQMGFWFELRITIPREVS